MVQDSNQGNQQKPQTNQGQQQKPQTNQGQQQTDRVVRPGPGPGDIAGSQRSRKGTAGEGTNSTGIRKK